MDINIDKLTNDEIWVLYSQIHKKLLKNGSIRSNNITGDRGEQIAIDTYNSIKNIPKLQMAPPSTKNIDAISVKGERYSIKTITYPNKTTGVFHGYGNPTSPVEKQYFEYLIVVVLDSFQPVLIVEINWEDFYKMKRWHSTMNAYNISLTNEVINKSKIIFKTDKSIDGWITKL